jgi:hypothetical protein
MEHVTQPHPATPHSLLPGNKDPGTSATGPFEPYDAPTNPTAVPAGGDGRTQHISLWVGFGCGMEFVKCVGFHTYPYMIVNISFP